MHNPDSQRVKEIDVKMIKQVEERKERRELDSRLKKLTKGLPISLKMKFDF